MEVKKKCYHCKKEYVAKINHPKHRFCSRKCLRADSYIRNEKPKLLHKKKLKLLKVCEYCKKEYTATKSNQKYCNLTCGHKGYYQNNIEKHKEYNRKNKVELVDYPEKKCKECEVIYKPKRKNQKFCNPKCQKKDEKRRHKTTKSYKKRHRIYKTLRKRQTVKAKLNVNWSEIQEFYDNRPEDCHVDHIIPLNHELVCGLHVPWNFQYLSAEDNIKKSNSFDGTYENVSWKEEKVL